MPPIRRHITPHSLPKIPHVSPLDTTPEHLIEGTRHMNTNNAAGPLLTPKLSVAAQELLTLLDKINVEMAEEIARVTAAINEVEDSVKLLRFERMKAACIRSAIYFPDDEERNTMQIL